jgi:hypothetical protein
MLPPSADRLALLYRISQDFNSSLDLDEVLNRVIDGHRGAPSAASDAARCGWVTLSRAESIGT